MAPKQLSGAAKRKKTERINQVVKSCGSIKRFVKPLKSPVQEEVVEEQVEEQVEEDVEIDEQEHAEEGQDMEVEQEEAEEHMEEHVNSNVNEEHVKLKDIFAPKNWDGLNHDEIKLLVERGPKRDPDVTHGPYDSDGRRFSATIYTRVLANMEKKDRKWLVYSLEEDGLFCFCCKVFRIGVPKGGLDGDGFRNWGHAFQRVKEHEGTLDHLINMNKWSEMHKRLNLNETIDKVQHEQFQKESEYWKQVILRIIALVKYLAKHNLAFRGSEEKLYKKGNGNFLGLVEMLEEFDPVIKEHVRRITSDEIHVHYLGHRIQNELILLLAQEVKNVIIKKIKEAKYYSIILDCTPDTSHQEQMTIIVRYVNLTNDSVTVEESFLGFLNVNDTTGKGLFEVTNEELKSLGLEIDDMRGQGYDNGANMKGEHQGVQSRFLKINPRAFYTPCGCHSLNLTLCDMANSSTKGKNFFGLIQRIYTIFANSINRWHILLNNVKGLTLKSMSQTRWESRVECVKAIRFQLLEVREALLEVGEKDNDNAIASEANSLAEKEFGEFEFLMSIVIWYQVLNQVNLVSKKLQLKDMHLDIAIKEVNRLLDYFKDYRENGFLEAFDEAKEIASQIGIEPTFTQRRLIKRKRRIDEGSSTQEASFTPEENFKVNYFLFIVDQAITSLQSRFKQFKEYDELFGFLFPHKLLKIEDKDLKLSCQNLEKALTFEDKSDIDANELYTELKTFKITQTGEFNNPMDVLKVLKDEEYFEVACVAYRVLLTIPVTVASAERSFSKLKLLKSYLRSTMSQERLSGLAMLTIESEILDSLNYVELIQQFATENARRASRFSR